MESVVIKPKEGTKDIFTKLLEGATPPEIGRASFLSSEIKFVQVFLKENRWEILISGDIKEDILVKAANFIRDKYNLDSVAFCRELVEDNKVDNALSKEEIPALKPEPEKINDTKPVKTEKSIKTEKSDKMAKPAKSKDEGVVRIENPGNLLFGKEIFGNAIPIENIQGEEKRVIIEGYIAEGERTAPRVSTAKTGTKILTFSIVDNTNGISCKKFFKGKKAIEEFEQIVGKIKGGMYVRAEGSVSFDAFEKDYSLLLDSLALKEKKGRMDTAEVKRVELHAHTKMSEKDAVVSAKDLIKTAAKWGHKAIAITDHGVVQAYPEAMNTVAKDKLDIKIIYGMEGYLPAPPGEKRLFHIIILAKNKIGLKNLYQLVSLSHLKYLAGKNPRPCIPKNLLAEFREGLIIGSACEAGELIRGILAGKSDEELIKIAEFYDYLEIQPIGNNDFLKRSERFPHINTDEDLININLKVASLAKKMGKMLVATCDSHFLNPEDAIYREILQKGQGYQDAGMQAPLYFRTTEEMLNEFKYLSEEEAYAAVVDNPLKIAESVEKFQPIPSGTYSPIVPGAEQEVRDMSYGTAKEMYGENLPEIVEKRLEQELTPIIGHGYAGLYLIAEKLVKKSNEDGYLVGSRGSVGSSFVATMMGITEVNPLPPHYRCEKCKHSEFITDGSVGCGYDLPTKNCPNCDEPMIKDGHDIPFAVFMGFNGDKEPDIDLNFSGIYQPEAHKFTEVMFGKDFAYRAGTISTIADKTAFGYALKYYEEKGIRKNRAFIEKMAGGIMGVKATTGQHPAGIMVVPRNMDIHYFTPVNIPANDKKKATITTHFDYHSISGKLLKLDILGHDDPTVIRMLEDLTGRDAKTIPFDDPETLKLFSSTDPLGLTPEELGANSGTFGIPEFRTSFTQQMIDDTHPNCFSDLVRISGFSHGTDVWLGNAQELIRGGTCTLKDAISARDDIMMYLIHNGVDPLLSFKTMENVRKGKGIAPEVVETLRKEKIPEWYIESCQKIKYLFPRAHATAYVMMAWRIAYCKVHYPLQYYAAYFSIRADEFDADVAVKGQDFVKQELAALDNKSKTQGLEVKERGTLAVLQLLNEMFLRGFTVAKVDLYKSAAEKFIVLDDKTLLPPLASLKGMGEIAPHNIEIERQKGEFTSIANLRKRASLSQPNVEVLKNHGCLKGMSESDQLSLF